MRAKVFVGLSGGVDSAVSAALLKEKGFDVVGVFIKIWRPEFIECTWKEDRIDAMRVCAALQIPYRELDLSEQYKKEVVDSMLADYAQGFTPNPDVLCNRSIKFGGFAKWARAQGADFIATGHYARIRQQGGHFELLRGADPEKDQSYFLHLLGQGELARALFPVGGMHKKEVRARAKSFALPVAEKHDSQGLCFIGAVSMPEFLSRFMPFENGPVLDIKGAVIGEHEGAAAFTLGERHGFSIRDAALREQPHYVVAIDTAKNAITVSPSAGDAKRSDALIAAPHWVHRPPAWDAELQAQPRYRHKPIPARLVEHARGLAVRFSEPALLPPGQSLVFYQGETCLGGGVIRKEAPSGSALSTRAPVRSIVRRVQ